MIMDLAPALLSAQNRRLFKFHNLANAKQQVLLGTFKGVEDLSKAFSYTMIICADSSTLVDIPEQVMDFTDRQYHIAPQYAAHVGGRA